MNSPTPYGMRARHRAGRGFTLIELLVTISIIAVLVTISIPATNRVLHSARAAQCMSHLKGLGTGLQVYLADHDNVMPELVIGRESKESEEKAIDNTLDEYVEDPDCFRCPADNKRLYETTGTSYSWNHLVNRQHVSELNLMGVIKGGARIPVINDKENFHKYRDVEVNILYADGHVSREIQFVVE
jgi:prepilin-type N-terminal cleavage/methylation domain-containing protein/prepilin-type processing-associated H-X9-DG protein